MTAPQLAPGQVVAGKYSIRALLGYGGATATYTAVLQPGRDVVVKLFAPQLSQRPDVLGALQQVAAVAAGLADATAPILESGFDPQTGAPFMVVDLATLPSLAQAVERGPFPPADVVLLLRGIARAVDAAHAQRLAHGALKPQNIFVGPPPDRPVRVIDFGVAVARAALPTSEGYAIAAPWMAPEQMQGTPGSAPADVFSAALVAFYAATGRSYWRSCQGAAPDLPAWQQEIAAPRVAPSARARELGATINPAFDGALVRALSLNPGERFLTIGELADTLAKAGGAGPQKMAMTMPLTAMPQAAQDLLRQAGAQAAAAQQLGGATTLAVNSPADAQWLPPQAAAQQAPAPMQPQAPMQQPMGPAPQQQGMPPGQPNPGAMLPTPYGGFQAPAMPPPQQQPQQGPAPMQVGARPGYSVPPESSVVVPKSKTGLIVALVLVGLLLVGGGVTAFLMFGRGGGEVTADTKPEPSHPASAASTTAPPPPPVTAATSATATAPPPPVETTDAAPAATAAADAGAPAATDTADAAPTTASVTVVCTPDCDSVKVDDKALDTTDAGVVPPTPMDLAGGPHTIVAGRASYITQTRKITVKAGQKPSTEKFFLTKPGAVVVKPPCGKFLERCP